jgi:hypothetical protein
MPLQPDMKYNGTVMSNSGAIESQSGTYGYEIWIECEDGRIRHTFWITPKTADKVRKQLVLLGANESRLGEMNYWEYELKDDIAGAEISFGTKEEEYNGKTSVRVNWIGKRSQGKPHVALAKMFGGAVAEPPAEEQPPVIDDSEIPF